MNSEDLLSALGRYDASNNSIGQYDENVCFNGHQSHDSFRSDFCKANNNSFGSDTDSGGPPPKMPRLYVDIEHAHHSRWNPEATFLDLGLVSKFDPSMENVQIEEKVKWLNSSDTDAQHLSADLLTDWLKWGNVETTIEWETRFCDPLMLHQILDAKKAFEQIDRHSFEKARAKCNPFEAIKCSIFQNRSAVKIANIDASLNFMFTDPKDENGDSLAPDLLYFADICAGPGGFSEYILWRNKWKAKGFGFTLRNEDDFNFHAFSAGQTETFDVFYGVKDDGNILDPDNMESLGTYLLNQTNGTGVHFLMADGGFPVDEKKSQETSYKQLYLCQCLAALTVVRDGGHFVVKLFDVFTLFSAGLVYLMYKCFKHITIMKPNSSRPGNSERYLIGKFKKSNCDTVRDHLFKINKEIWSNSSADCLELVPYETIEEDRHFFDYFCESNNTIGQNQIVGLHKIATFCAYKNLIESRQEEIRHQCLKAWMLPNKVPKIQPKSTDETFKQLMNEWLKVKEFMMSPERELTSESDLCRIFHTQSDWFFVPVDTIEETPHFMRTFLISHGGYNLSYYTRSGTWKLLQNIALEISGNTLIYGDIVSELNADKTTVTALHIIDGIVLGGIDIRHLRLQDRLKLCESFANSLNKPSKSVTCGDEQILSSPISCKKLYGLHEFRKFFDQLSYCTLKDGRKRVGYKTENCPGIERWYMPRGLLFFNDMKPNIGRAFSKTYQKPYFVDKVTGKTFFQDQIKDPQSIFASFKTTFVNRYVWEWKLHNQVYDKLDGDERIDGILYRCDLDEFIFE